MQPIEPFQGGNLDFQMAVTAFWQPMLNEAGVRAGDALGTLVVAQHIMNDPEVQQLSALAEFQIQLYPEEAPCVVTIDWKKLFAFLGKDGRSRIQDRLRSKSPTHRRF